METFFPKKSPKFFCDICCIGSDNKKDFGKHLLTAKHKKLTKVNKSKQISPIFPQKSPDDNCKLTCEFCKKKYTSRAGIWKHRKICTDKHNNDLNISDKEIINALIKQTEKLTKIIENGTNNTTNSHNTTNIGKNFNLSFYLNETCKDALNISEFVSSIKLNIEDLEHTGRSGYIEGISNIFIKNLHNLEKHLRPLHCSDLKREVLYIKDNNKWEKEVDQKPILTKAIKTIANENIKYISEWKKNYPDCTNSDSNKNNLYLKIVSNSMSGATKEESEQNYNKIIKHIAKETVIDKNLQI
jgi:hypothetical protein